MIFDEKMNRLYNETMIGEWEEVEGGKWIRKSIRLRGNISFPIVFFRLYEKARAIDRW